MERAHLMDVRCMVFLVLSASWFAWAPAAPPERRNDVEADWALQDATRGREPLAPVTTAEDAAGAVDGVKEGGWSSHAFL